MVATRGQSQRTSQSTSQVTGDVGGPSSQQLDSGVVSSGRRVTRRSAASASQETEEGATATPLQQRRASVRSSGTAARRQAKQPEPIPEEEAAETADTAPTPLAHTAAAGGVASARRGLASMSRRMVARGDDEKVTSPSGGADAAATRKGVPAQPDIGAAAAVAVAGANSSSEENSDDEGGASINTSSGTSANSDGDSDDSSGGGGGDLMSSLAASIRQALQVKATGGKGTSHRAQPAHGRRPGKAAAAGTAAAAAANAGGKGSAGADQEDEAALLVRQQAQATWAPQILLPKAKAPTREVHRTEITASKEVGLAKQLVAPVRDAKAKPAASSALAVTGGAGGGSKEAAAAAAKAVDTAGRKWFDLPATQITDDVKRELRLLRLRGALDAQRFYKSAGGTKFPKYFHMGTVIDGPEDYYSGRLTNRERKTNFTEEVLADRQLAAGRRKRYNKLQDEANRHNRVKRRKTSMPREQQPKRKPKH